MKYNEFKLSFYFFFPLYLAYQAVGRLPRPQAFSASPIFYREKPGDEVKQR